MINTILEIMNGIEIKYPLSFEHADDGRYTWPQRWQTLRAELEKIEKLKEYSDD